MFADYGGNEIELGLVEKVDDFHGAAHRQVEQRVAGERKTVFRPVRARDERSYMAPPLPDEMSLVASAASSSQFSISGRRRKLSNPSIA